MADSQNYNGPENYARARLFDLFIGDWDYRDQWRWAAFRRGMVVELATSLSAVIGTAYGNYDGLLLGFARTFVPKPARTHLRGISTKARWRGMNGKWNDQKIPEPDINKRAGWTA
jgi:hypothetical protein